MTVFYSILLLLFSSVAPVGGQDTPVTLHYRILEEAAAFTFVGDIVSGLNASIQVDDSVRSGVLFTTLTQSNSAHARYFILTRDTGVLRTREPIDRDVVCPNKITCTLLLHVAMHAPAGIVALINVIVTVDDLNDNAPSFVDTHVTRSIPENADLGTSVRLPSADDADSPRNSVYSYRLISGPDELEMKVDSRDLYLVVKARLDREKQASYRVMIVAVDGGDQPKSGTLTVNVNVLDVNDNRPVFTDQLYMVTVREDVRPGTTVTSVTAVDADTGSHDNHVYALSSESYHKHGRHFAVQPNTGDIVVTDKLDYEMLELYDLVITAREQQMKSIPSETRVQVRLLDVNDNPPEILLSALTPSEHVQVSETAEIGSFVAFLSVRDVDSGPNGQVTCSLESDEFEMSQISVTEFKLQTVTLLDREQKANYNVEFMCTDGGSPTLTSRTTFQVHVLDDNDNSPTFDKTIYTATIKENNAVDEFILTVSATDPDDALNGHVTYSLRGLSARYLRIDALTGDITSRVSFDYEEIQDITVDVIASDNAATPRTMTALLSLQIVDENDEAPVFEQINYNFSVLENMPVGTKVGNVVAKDGDGTHFNKIRFSLIDAEAYPFSINAYGGELFTTKPLDRESKQVYMLLVIAVDELIPTLNSTVSVFVSVDDVNDNSPMILFPAHVNATLQVSSETPIGYIIYTVTATDLDQGRNAQLEYTMKPESEFFAIETTSGVISVQRHLASIQDVAVRMRVCVQDSGIPVNSVDLRLNIFVNGSLPFDARTTTLIGGHKLVIIVCVASISGVAAVLLLTAILVMRRREQARKQNERLRKYTSVKNGLLETNVNHSQPSTISTYVQREPCVTPPVYCKSGTETEQLARMHTDIAQIHTKEKCLEWNCDMQTLDDSIDDSGRGTYEDTNSFRPTDIFHISKRVSSPQFAPGLNANWQDDCTSRQRPPSPGGHASVACQLSAAVHGHDKAFSCRAGLINSGRQAAVVTTTPPSYAKSSHV